MRYFPVMAALIVGLLVGCCGGFFLGILSTKGGAAFLERLVETEQSADVKSAKTFERGGFRLQYPGNWSVDEADEDYDPDHLFSIDSPGSCHVAFVIYDSETSAESSTDSHVSAFVPKLLRDPKKSDFDTWGVFEGSGVKLEGKILGVNEGSIRIFSHSSASLERTFTVREFCYDEDMASVQPGFELVERTFALN